MSSDLSVPVTRSPFGWAAVATARYGPSIAGLLDVVDLAGGVQSLTVPVDCTPASSGSGADRDPETS